MHLQVPFDNSIDVLHQGSVFLLGLRLVIGLDLVEYPSTHADE